MENNATSEPEKKAERNIRINRITSLMCQLISKKHSASYIQHL